MPGNVFTETWKIRNKLGKVMREMENNQMGEVMKSKSLADL